MSGWYNAPGDTVTIGNTTVGNATSMDSNDGHDGPDNGVGVLLLAVFALMINLVLFVPPYLVRRRRIREQLARRAAFTAARRGTDIVGGSDPNERYDQIEHHLVSKQIRAHDKLCEKVCRLRAIDCRIRLRKETMSTVESLESDDDDDDEEEVTSGALDLSETGSATNECPICFESFQVNDIVSWSATPACRHVFHHLCIKQWLLNNTGCPFCRETFLAVDRPEASPTPIEHDIEKGDEPYRQSLYCYYCVDHGIVPLPPTRDERLEEDDWTSFSDRARQVPDRNILLQMREPSKMQCEENIETAVDNAEDSEVGSGIANQQPANSASYDASDNDNSV